MGKDQSRLHPGMGKRAVRKTGPKPLLLMSMQEIRMPNSLTGRITIMETAGYCWGLCAKATLRRALQRPDTNDRSLRMRSLSMKCTGKITKSELRLRSGHIYEINLVYTLLPRKGQTVENRQPVETNLCYVYLPHILYRL